MSKGSQCKNGRGNQTASRSAANDNPTVVIFKVISVVLSNHCLGCLGIL